MKKRIYRWGIIGAGKMADNMAHDLSLTARSQVHAVCGQSAATGQVFAARYQVPNVLTDVEALASHPEVDVVYISTPNQLHYPHARLALQHGKAVLLEKPFTLNAKQAAELVALARQQGVFLMEAMWVRYLPVIERLDQLLAEQAIGELRMLRASFHLRLNFPPTHRVYNLAMGGGALLDLGIYPVSLAFHLFKQPPERISSLAHLGDTGVDVNFGALFAYPQGGLAMLSAGVDNEHPEDISIIGTRGSIRLHATRAWKYERLSVTAGGGKEQTLHFPLRGAGYPYQVEEVVACLDRGTVESSRMPLDETIAILHALDTVRAQWGLVYPGE